MNLLDAHLRALTLRDEPQVPLTRAPTILLLAIHLASIAAFWRYYHQPVWLAAPSLALVLVAPIIQLRARRSLAVETLAPLFFLYAILAARYVAIRILFAREPYVDEASLADPRLIFFQVEVTAFVVLVYIALVQIACLTRGRTKSRSYVGLSLVLLTAAIAWFSAEAIRHRTRGVTATDPYAYAQMAVDLVERGTPLHSFPLFREIANLGIAWYPVEHIGYRLFDNLTGSAPTVWPMGGSIWIAGFYRVLGEEGLYLATPIAALLSLLVFAFFVWKYLSDFAVERAAVTAISVALLATSWEQVDRSIVPLVDAEAQLFSTLTLFFALDVLRSKRFLLFGVLTGVSLAAAYYVRHTQVLLAIPILLGSIRLPFRARLDFLVPAALSALLLAIPDLYYHQLYFGGWFAPESNELALFSWANFVPGMVQLGERFFAGNEFGYLILFLLYGIYRAARDDALKFSMLAAWILLLVAAQVPYAAIKMRDLLPEFPAVTLLTAYGMVGLARDVRNWASGHVIASTLVPSASSPKILRGLIPQGAVAVTIFLIILFPSMRTRFTIQRPFQPVKITFGYLTAEQRASFDQIAELTPPSAVIGSTMNDGPIDLYSHRLTFRPGAWGSSERAVFVGAMSRSNRPIFLLEDGKELSDAVRDLGSRYVLKRIATLDVPIFGDSDLTTATLWEIEQ
jgi:hypothetical protein